MGIKAIYTWNCDLCRTEAKSFSDKTGPRGWIKFIVEDPNVERSFFDKCVCPSCIESIVKAKQALDKTNYVGSGGAGGGGIVA